MDRGSDKHAPRLDESLKADTRSLVQGSPVEARASEGREQEGPGEGEPTPDARLVGGPLVGGDSRWPTDGELEARTDLARHLEPSVFPAEREALVASAERNHAPTWITELLRALPDGPYETTESVWEALGGSAESRF
ncbi:MAG: DUF2795 domain-containing protein [Acidimicrobiales bacterium]|nr:DUF2795 domain-containing protein [Actinomycetota bacterium]